MKTEIKINCKMPEEDGELKILVRLLKPYLWHDPESTWTLTTDSNLHQLGEKVCIVEPLSFQMTNVLRLPNYRTAAKTLGLLRNIQRVLRANATNLSIIDGKLQ